MSSDADSAEQPIPPKYGKPSDITDDAFLAAVRALGGGFFRLHDVAWQLSNFERPSTGISAAPDVGEFLLKRKAQQLVRDKVISHAKDTLYLLPPDTDSD